MFADTYTQLMHRKLYVGIAQKKKIELDVGHGKNSSKPYFYTQTMVIQDILHWDMFTSAVEDIPQTVIVLILIIVFDNFTTISFFSVFFSCGLILSKLVRLCIARDTGCESNVKFKKVRLVELQQASVS